MAIIHHNVNVIDHHGQIIASGERHRIGEQHEIAREVIRTGKRICINNTAEAARFQNVHPGINHPIIYDDRVVMVVGISGDPAAISRYAELAVLTAELLVRQAVEMRETNWRQRLRDTLFGQYLDQGASPAGQEALHRLVELGFAFDAPLVPVVVTVQVEQHQLSEILSTLLREFSQLSGVRDVILLGSNEILAPQYAERIPGNAAAGHRVCPQQSDQPLPYRDWRAGGQRPGYSRGHPIRPFGD
jgi:sugar diacid utilization regulator